MTREDETYYEVIGYDEDWDIINDPQVYYDWFYAQEEAEEMKDTGKYAHIIIRKTESYEYGVEE